MLTRRKMQVTKAMLQQLPSWSIRSGVWLHYWERTSTGTCGMSIMAYAVVEAEGRECEHLRSKWSGTEEEREREVGGWAVRILDAQCELPFASLKRETSSNCCHSILIPFLMQVTSLLYITDYNVSVFYMFGPEYFNLQFAVWKHKYQNIQKKNFTWCFVWV